KRELVDDDTAALARLTVEELLGDVPLVEVSTRTGEGIEQLRAQLDALAEGVPRRSGDGPARLPVDRSFTLRGIGTVVTGTLWSGTVSPGDRLSVEPGGAEVRVRSVHVHDVAVESAAAGQRVALALVGTERGDVRRGDTLATAGTLRRTYRLECDIGVPADAEAPLRSAQRLTVHHATSETPARLAVRDGDEIPPGGSGRVQLRLQRKLAAAEGDHVVLRSTAPQATVAGGVVVDAAPTRSGQPPQPDPAVAAPAPARPLSDEGA